MKMPRDEFQANVTTNLLPTLVGKSFDAACTMMNDFLNPFVENATIEGFDYEYDEETFEMHVDTYYSDGGSDRFALTAVKEN